MKLRISMPHPRVVMVFFKAMKNASVCLLMDHQISAQLTLAADKTVGFSQGNSAIRAQTAAMMSAIFSKPERFAVNRTVFVQEQWKSVPGSRKTAPLTRSRQQARLVLMTEAASWMNASLLMICASALDTSLTQTQRTHARKRSSAEARTVTATFPTACLCWMALHVGPGNNATKGFVQIPARSQLRNLSLAAQMGSKITRKLTLTAGVQIACHVLGACPARCSRIAFSPLCVTKLWVCVRALKARASGPLCSQLGRTF
mmetsp:Transcript_1785/g.3488  ORF Transcript_1785/g.3488 Transcript_1785/m.3488 type:complete len:259 (-) Transcript_1785:380-1156(-)